MFFVKLETFCNIVAQKSLDRTEAPHILGSSVSDLSCCCWPDASIIADIYLPLINKDARMKPWC